MTDLSVDFHQLEDSQSALNKIKTEFENASGRTDADKDIWSNGHVSDAMHSFATNWNDHRKKLLDAMGDAYHHTDECLTKFKSADGSLAKALTTQQTGPTAHGAS